MKLREILGIEEEDYKSMRATSVFNELFFQAIMNGAKEIELDNNELCNFMRWFSPQIPYNLNIAGESFIFWGVKIIKI
jgi:hypothetical protein